MNLEKYIYSECQNPAKVRIYNGITNCYEYKDVPCGKCYHCKITRINEWVTRMVIQSNMSNYVYYGTLTYGSKKLTKAHLETLSVMTDFNKTKTSALTPLVLRKDHLQKFFKRLRKNTGIKLQYAACGEYGGTYARPHFHYIIWSNKPISKLDIYKAWTSEQIIDDNGMPIILGSYIPFTTKYNVSNNRIVLGRIEHRDMKRDAYFNPNDKDITSVYKYICKYIQKYDFKFNELPNIKQHEKVFKADFKPFFGQSHDDYDDGTRTDEYIKSKGIKNFYDYQKVFSPFFTCSKKPAIGYQYLEKYIGEFQKGDFRLFGLSGNYIFPLYFVRKTKEKICPLKAQSETNDSATSYSRLPKMATLIHNIQAAQQFAEDFDYAVQLFRSEDSYYYYESTERLNDLEECKQLYGREDEQLNRAYLYKFKREYLGLHDIENKVYYSFRGDYFAMYDTRQNYLGEASLEDVKQLIIYYYERLKKQILIPLMAKSALSANKKEALINEYGGIDKFNEAKALCLKQFNNHIDERQRKYKQSKTFE